MRPVILLWFLAASLAAQTAGVEGVVLNRANGQPLSDVHITLLVVDIGGAGIDKAYGAISDRAGHFSVTDMPAGVYFLLVRRPGFVQERVPGMIPLSSLGLKAGQHITDYKLEMTPRAVIAGRVVDEYGDPVQAVFVQVEGLTPDSQPVNMFGLSGSATDDCGEFRIVTAPGRYYLQAAPRSFSRGGTVEIRTDGSSGAPYAATYYPSAADKSQAGVVEVGAGQDVTGMDIRLTRASAAATRPLTVSGVVTGAPEGERATVSLRFGDSATAMYSGRSTTAGMDGRFSISGLEPKFYRVVAQYSSGKDHLQSPPVDLHLTTSDAPGLQLALAPGDDLAGSLEMSGDPPTGAAAPKLTVHLEPADSNGFGNADTSAVPGKDGSLRIAGIFPARYRVSVEPLPENAYVKSIALDGAAVQDAVLDLTHGVKAARLKIAVGLNGGQLSGKVLDHDGEPLMSPLGMLLVWKDEKQEDHDDQRVAEGKYSLKGLRPGKYRVLAIDATEMLGALGNVKDQEEIEKTMKALAEEIEIKEGDRIVKDLKVADKEKLGVPAKH